MMRLILISAAAISLAGCQTAKQAAPPSNFCEIARPIFWSSADTRATKEQIDAYNRRGKALCGWGKKK